MPGMKYEKLKLGEVLRFWFEELDAEQWFAGSKELDAEITERFTDIHAEVAAGEFWRYRTDAHAYLAEVLVLDQFSRQMFRGEPKAFAWDGMALTLAQQAIASGLDTELDENERLFLYLPFQHSESALIHEEAMRLFEALAHEKAFEMERIHRDIIDRFGRYPHRNEQLGRETTPEEADYLRENHEEFFSS